MRGKLHHRKGHAAVSRNLGGQDWIINEVKANRPVQAFVIFIEPALDQITNHGNQFIEIVALRCHFRFMASRDKRAIVLFDLKDEFFLHGLILACEIVFDKASLRDVLIFEIRIQLQNLRARVAGGDEAGDHSRRDAQSANASAPAHDIRIQSDSIQHIHGNNLTVLPRESNFSFAAAFIKSPALENNQPTALESYAPPAIIAFLHLLRSAKLDLSHL
jgi:hypothetical protein